MEKLKRNWYLLNMYQFWLYLPIINGILWDFLATVISIFIEFRNNV